MFYTTVKLSLLAGIALLFVCVFSSAKGPKAEPVSSSKTDSSIDKLIENVPVSRVDADQEFIELLELHNAARTQLYRFQSLACKRSRSDAPVLRWNSKLAIAAQKQADWMEKRDTLSHGPSLGVRAKAVNYKFQSIAEKIANAYLPADPLFQLWLDSNRHCKNILNPVYREIGIGKNGKYWSVVLANPA